MTKLSEYLHPASIGENLGVAENMPRKWASQGNIPVHRNFAIGYRLFQRNHLEKFLWRIERPTKVFKPR